MSFLYWPKVAVLALLPAAAIAQQVQQFVPTDANAPVPASGYVSVFENYRPAAEDQVSPVEVWRAANEEVARNDPHDGHAGHMATPAMKPEVATPRTSTSQSDHARHSGHTMMPDMNAKPAAQKSGSIQVDPHAVHRGHSAMPGMKAAPTLQSPTSKHPDPHAGHGAMPEMKAEPATQKPASMQPDPHAGHGSNHNMQGK